MNSAQDYSNLPEDQVGNNFVPMQNPNNNDDNNINYLSNPSYIDTFEFYLPLPNDTVYRVTYTRLHSLEIATLLNKGVHHQNVQRQQICQQVQQHIHQPQQQSQTYDTIPNSQVDMTPSNSQVYSSNNIYNNVIPSNEAITEDTGYNYTTNSN
jgi:hypothetical protein